MALAEALRVRHPLWHDTVHAEQTGILTNPRLRPDIVVAGADGLPVIIETEYFPGRSVEDEATSRLGQTVQGHRNPVEQAIAVRIPAELAIRGQANLRAMIEDTEIDYCTLVGKVDAPVRWPAEGWLTGNVDDLARCVECCSLSEQLVEEGTRILEEGITIAAGEFGRVPGPRYRNRLGELLNQEPGPQTTRMAMAIVANALTFHLALAESGAHGIKGFDELYDDQLKCYHPHEVLAVWRDILNINYWPIFDLALKIWSPLEGHRAAGVMAALIGVARKLANLGATTFHDLSGRMFQRMISDRKFLATFYTLPSSATLLAELAMARTQIDWRNLDAYDNLTVADFACGTGILMSAAYRAILSRYRRAGGDDRQLHPYMMERGLLAADIMPAATHLTAAQLSSAHPSVTFGNTRIYTMPYGESSMSHYPYAIGSLDLIHDQEVPSLFPTGQRQARGEGSDDNAAEVHVPPESVDLVIMNPPFTRPTNHESTDVPVPSFSGFATPTHEQRRMSLRLSKIRSGLKNPAGHGNAGLASNFIDLAHAKVKPAGVIALVLPIAFIRGTSWRAARELVAAEYTNIAVVTIAAAGNTDRAFSADTGMAEALLVATKRKKGETEPEAESAGDTLFVNLFDRPRSLLEATELARMVKGPGPLRVGGLKVATAVQGKLTDGGCASVGEESLVKTMMELARGQLVLPRHSGEVPIPITTLGQLGERGPLHRDVGNLPDSAHDPRGPFKIVPIQGVANYPILWAHDAVRERNMVVEPDRAGEVHEDRAEHAVAVWSSATRLHFTLDFRINSQPLAACLTPVPAIGGRAWPSFQLHDRKWEELVTLWSNSTLGMMCFWWTGSRQQQGRSVLTISGLPGLLAVDPRSLGEVQISESQALFKRFGDRTLLPANEAYRDEARQELDRALLIDVLGLPEAIMEGLGVLRKQWCAEPTVHGGKQTAPHTAL